MAIQQRLTSFILLHISLNVRAPPVFFAPLTAVGLLDDPSWAHSGKAHLREANLRKWRQSKAVKVHRDTLIPLDLKLGCDGVLVLYDKEDGNTATHITYLSMWEANSTEPGVETLPHIDSEQKLVDEMFDKTSPEAIQHWRSNWEEYGAEFYDDEPDSGVFSLLWYTFKPFLNQSAWHNVPPPPLTPVLEDGTLAGPHSRSLRLVVTKVVMLFPNNTVHFGLQYVEKELVPLLSTTKGMAGLVVLYHHDKLMLLYLWRSSASRAQAEKLIPQLKPTNLKSANALGRILLRKPIIEHYQFAAWIRPSLPSEPVPRVSTISKAADEAEALPTFGSFSIDAFFGER